MAHDHGHDPTRTAGGNRARLGIALGITLAVLVVQLAGAAVSGSLALLGDAGHLSSDGIGLAVALAASVVASRPATDRHTFGFQRMEVLAALANGLILVVVAAVVAVEAVRRLSEPAIHVDAVTMLVIAAAGLAANVAAYLVLRGGDRRSLNLRGALLEVLGDLLGSIAAIVAAVVILVTGYSPADAIASLVIAALILPRAVLLLRDVVRVLSESAPRDRDVQQIRDHLGEVPGVIAVHDVHIWTITSGAPVFTAHVVVESGIFERGETHTLLDALGGCLAGHFDVAHSTFQLEPAGHAEHEEHAHR
ncbi:MAG: cation diffusion facilitator family transporter [Protaetiibacter sp.]